jgi:pentatricopeptide repeat protein
VLRYALVFSDKVNGAAFRKEDYVRSIGPLFNQLVHHMAKAQMWDQAVYWLQQLLNHDVSVRACFGGGSAC